MKCINKDCYLNGSLERHSKIKDYNYPEPKSDCRKFDSETEMKNQCACFKSDE